LAPGGRRRHLLPRSGLQAAENLTIDFTEETTVSDPHSTEGHRLAVSLTVAGLRDDLAATGVLLEPFAESVERSALIFAVRLLVDQVRFTAARTDTPVEEIAAAFSDGLLRLANDH
jgi:hypothetical protein